MFIKENIINHSSMIKLKKYFQFYFSDLCWYFNGLQMVYRVFNYIHGPLGTGIMGIIWYSDTFSKVLTHNIELGLCYEYLYVGCHIQFCSKMPRSYYQYYPQLFWKIVLKVSYTLENIYKIKIYSSNTISIALVYLQNKFQDN